MYPAHSCAAEGGTRSVLVHRTPRGGQRDAGQPRDGRVATDRATGGRLPLGRSAVAHRCGGGGRQDADPTSASWVVAALSIAAHKFQGPLGIGALIVRHEVTLAPMLFGGHQQEGMRPGTESVALAVGMQTALELWQKEQDEHCRRLTALRDRFEAELKAGRPGVIVHSEAAARLPQHQQHRLSRSGRSDPACWPSTWRESPAPSVRRVPAARRSFLPPCGRWAFPTTSLPAVCVSAWERPPPRRKSTRPSYESCRSAENWSEAGKENPKSETNSKEENSNVRNSPFGFPSFVFLFVS